MATPRPTEWRSRFRDTDGPLAKQLIMGIQRQVDDEADFFESGIMSETPSLFYSAIFGAILCLTEALSIFGFFVYNIIFLVNYVRPVTAIFYATLDPKADDPKSVAYVVVFLMNCLTYSALVLGSLVLFSSVLLGLSIIHRKVAYISATYGFFHVSNMLYLMLLTFIVCFGIEHDLKSYTVVHAIANYSLPKIPNSPMDSLHVELECCGFGTGNLDWANETLLSFHETYTDNYVRLRNDFHYVDACIGPNGTACRWPNSCCPDFEYGNTGNETEALSCVQTDQRKIPGASMVPYALINKFYPFPQLTSKNLPLRDGCITKLANAFRSWAYSAIYSAMVILIVFLISSLIFSGLIVRLDGIGIVDPATEYVDGNSLKMFDSGNEDQINPGPDVAATLRIRRGIPFNQDTERERQIRLPVHDAVRERVDTMMRSVMLNKASTGMRPVDFENDSVESDIEMLWPPKRRRVRPEIQFDATHQPRKSAEPVEARQRRSSKN